MGTMIDQWWDLTVSTYTFIWPAIPFAIAYGLWRGWRRHNRRG